MRKFVLSLAATGAALAFATPAAAQYYPQPPRPYNYNGYGYNNYGGVRALQARVNAVENQIRRLDRRDAIRDKRADRLKHEANSIERRLRQAARHGLNPREANDIQVRIAGLEQRVQYAAGNGYGRGQSYGYDRRDRR